MISVDELSKLYYEAYPDFLHERLVAQTDEIEQRLEKELKEAFPDKFLNFYISLNTDNWLLWWEREGEHFVSNLKKLGYNVRVTRDRFEGDEKVTLNITWDY